MDLAVVIDERRLRQRLAELQNLGVWRRSLAVRRGKLGQLEQSVKQMAADLAEEEKDWVAEADRLRLGDPGIEITTTRGDESRSS